MVDGRKRTNSLHLDSQLGLDLNFTPAILMWKYPKSFTKLFRIVLNTGSSKACQGVSLSGQGSWIMSKKPYGSAMKVEERWDCKAPRNSSRYQILMYNQYIQGLGTYIKSTWCISKSLAKCNKMSLWQNQIVGGLCYHYYLFRNEIMCVKMLLQ